MGPGLLSVVPGLLLVVPGLLSAAPAPEARRFVGGGPQPGRFWHITDLHLDTTYHQAVDPTQVCLSSKGAPAISAGIYGDFLCDSPYKLIQSALTHMSHVTPQADFIIWTGDSPPHVPVGQLSPDTVIQLLSNMTETIRDHFPRLPVFPALGNHDYWPQDQMPASTNAIYQAAARLWAPWLTVDALHTLRQGGFYSQLARPGLRVVSLNTVLYYGPDNATANATDPAGQYQWLQATLEEAMHKQEKVFIIAHVPVGYLPFARGVTAVREPHNDRLVSIFQKYSHVIQGHFYGHTHRDSVMVLLDPQGEPQGSMFVSPALTPIKSVSEQYSNNPALRLCFHDASDFSMLDIWQYYLNLTEANLRRRARWRLEYVMTDAYGLKDLRPRSLLTLALSFRVPLASSFDKYFNHFMVSYDDRIRCQEDCKLSQVCAVLHLQHTAYSQCVRGRSVI